MISFPVFQHLYVQDYGMYPGDSDQGLEIPFEPGLTLVIGANGLGKTTLVTLLFRLCTGAYDIPGLSRGGELGTRSVEATELNAQAKRIFGARVTDNAASATATLRFALGTTEIEVTRSLANLALLELSIDGRPEAPTEEHYQDTILQFGGLSKFGDWVLLLRHLTFYFEDRRALVWDPTAQRQILRLLFLPPDTAAEWNAREREILERDSRMRNLQAALGKEEVAVKKLESSVGTSGDIRQELANLQGLQEVDRPRLDQVNERVAALDAARQNLRLSVLRAERDHENAYRNLERLQLRAIDDAFPTSDDTAKYLFAKLFSEEHCLTCGHSAPVAAEELRNRLSLHQCVVCGSTLETPSSKKPSNSRSFNKARNVLQTSTTLLHSATTRRAEAEQDFVSLVTEVQELTAKIADRDATIESLVKRLPPADADLIEQRSELTTLRGRVEMQKAQLGELRGEFVHFIAGVNRHIAQQKEAVQAAFTSFAGGFLLEECSLLWSTHKARLGESGQQIEFPGFELQMSGADFPSPVLRSGPEQVSESQREFIDLAFRMTLMTVAGAVAQGTLVIDAPESSLDAVFVTRAADVLNRFADPAGANRLIVTSNLIEGDLIPEMMRKASIRSPKDPRVVDLLRLAAPTAATKALAPDYGRVRARLFERAREAS